MMTETNDNLKNKEVNKTDFQRLFQALGVFTDQLFLQL